RHTRFSRDWSSDVCSSDLEDMQAAAEKIHAHGAEFVVIKGGKQLKHDKAADLLFDGKKHYLLTSEKTDTSYNHGAGCTFAAAIKIGRASCREGANDPLGTE